MCSSDLARCVGSDHRSVATDREGARSPPDARGNRDPPFRTFPRIALFRKTASAPSSRVADPDDVTYGMTTPTITALTQAKPLIDMRNVMRTQQPLGIVHPSSALYMRNDRAVSHRASPRLAVSRSSAPTRRLRGGTRARRYARASPRAAAGAGHEVSPNQACPAPVVHARNGSSLDTGSEDVGTAGDRSGVQDSLGPVRRRAREGSTCAYGPRSAKPRPSSPERAFSVP